MAGKRGKALGRGLEALFNDAQTDEKKETDIMYIDIHKITPNLNQPRKQFNPDKINDLSESIQVHGVIQPIIVKSIDAGYEIIAGERRWRAAKKSGLKEIPCIIKEIDEKHHMLLAMIENLQREDLNALEEAKAFEHMMKSYEMTQEEVSKNVGKSRPYIANALRLLKLPESIQELLLDNKISSGHARALINIKDPNLQSALAQEIIDKGLSVRQIENATDRKKSKKRKAKRHVNKDAQLLSIEDDLKKVLGTKVSINHKGKKGKLEIEYYSQEELERLIELLTSV